MGAQLSRIRSCSSLRLPPPSSLEQSVSNPSSNSSSYLSSTVGSDLSSYEAACRSDGDLRNFDSSLQARTSRTINSIAVGLEGRSSLSLSLESFSQFIGFHVESNEEIVKMIVQNHKDICKSKELSDLVDDYFDNSLATLEFCAALDMSLKRAGQIQSIINVALRKFHEEHNSSDEVGTVKDYSKTLEELGNFKTAGDPFTVEFFRVFDSVRSRQLLMLEKLRAKKKKLDKKLGKLKGWKRVSNVIFVVAFASVLICSVVAAAVSAPAVVTALVAAAAVPLGSMGRWLNSVWKKCEKDLMGQRETIRLMEFGSCFVINDLENIRALVQRFQIEIEALLVNAEFATRGDEAVPIAVEEIKKQVDGFVKTIEDLRAHANKCTEDTRKSRAMILRMMWSYRGSSLDRDIGMVS